MSTFKVFSLGSMEPSDDSQQTWLGRLGRPENVSGQQGDSGDEAGQLKETGWNGIPCVSRVVSLGKCPQGQDLS